MSDDYEPAITETVTDETGAESTITTRTPEAKTAPVLQDGEKGDNPELPPGRDSRGQRQVSDKTRAMMKAIAEKLGKEEITAVSDDLVPMGTDDDSATGSDTAAATPLPPATPQPEPVAVTTPILPALPVPRPPPPPPPVDTAKLKEFEAKEKALATAQEQLSAKEKLLPNLVDLIEKPGATLANWLKEVYGVTDPEEMKQVIADVTAELSETGLDTKLPSDFKAGLDSRKAMRALRAHKGEIGKAQAALAAEKAALEKTAAEAKAKSDAEALEADRLGRVQQMIAPALAQYPFLADPEVTEGLQANVIVLKVVEEQDRIARQWMEQYPGHQLPDEYKPNLERAMQHADKYYKAQAEQKVAKAEALKAKIKPTVAPAVASPGKVVTPGPVAAQKPATQLPVARAEPATDTDEPIVDRRDRRAAAAKALFQKHFKNQART